MDTQSETASLLNAGCRIQREPDGSKMKEAAPVPSFLNLRARLMDGPDLLGGGHWGGRDRAQ
jgi:hypothetical protein